MNDFPDKDLDSIFREGADNQDFPFKEDAWEKMDGMLDTEVQKHNKRRWAILIFLLLSTTAIGWYAYNATTTSKEEIKNTPRIDIATTNNNTIQKNVKETSTEISIDKEDLLNPENVNEIKDNTSNTHASKNELVGKSPDNFTTASNESNNTRTRNVIVPQNTELQITTSTYEKATDYTPINISNELVDINNTRTTDNITDKQIANVDKTKTIFNTNLISNLRLSTIATEQLPINEDYPQLPDVNTKNNHLKVGLILGQEWSSVGMMNDSKKGYKLGLELAYQFGNRFQISTGITASKKKYETQGSNYQARVERWSDAEVPQTVQGTCDVLEIPFDFTYYFKGYESSSFFVNGGLNSYLMRKEWYDYEYGPDNTNPNLPAFWNTDNMKNSHFLSVTNFSIGYQRILNDNMTIQLAPYIQVPLTGIGDGQVKLYTTGLQMKMFFGR